MKAKLKASGRYVKLHTDETLTLAFPGSTERGSEYTLAESTPAQLRHLICEASLRNILDLSDDQNERSKAARALEKSDDDWKGERVGDDSARAFGVLSDPAY